MADEIEFVNGLIVKAPHQNAPDFVKCAISIKVADLSAWLAGKSDEWINIDVKESRGGKWFATVNTWKPGSKNPATKPAATRPAADHTGLDDAMPW